MSNAELNPRPVAVSPLIRFSRWTLLGLGVLYGAYHYNKLSKRENARREQELREKPMRDAKLAEERKRLMAEEAKMIDDLSRPAK